MHRLSRSQRVDYATAKARALGCLKQHPGVPLPASAVGVAIWPEASMTAQGLGGAASRILKRMERDGLAKWIVTYRGGKPIACGYVLAGRWADK